MWHMYFYYWFSDKKKIKACILIFFFYFFNSMIRNIFGLYYIYSRKLILEVEDDDLQTNFVSMDNIAHDLVNGIELIEVLNKL